MSIPGTFSMTELATARQLILSKIGKATITASGKMIGDPFITYTELANGMGWSIDDEWDGDRMGGLAGQVSEQEINLGGPFIGACVVKKGKKRPGFGFYKYGMSLGRMPEKSEDRLDPELGTEENKFWAREVEASVRKYGR